MHRIIAVVVAYRNDADLLLCLEQLHNIDEIENIIVVDNSFSEIGSCVANIARNLLPKIHHVIPERNLGYSGGNNFGISVARELLATRVLVCNPDVSLQSSTLVGLIDEMESQSIDLLSPFMRERNKSGVTLEFKSPGWDLWLGRGVIHVPPDATPSRFIPSFYGACFLADMKLLDSVGPLSEDFFLYCEELDYCYRMAGTGFHWNTSRVWGVFHDRGSSISPSGGPSKSRTSLFHATRSSIVIGRKYWPYHVLPWTLVRCVWAASFIVRGRVANGFSVLQGIHSGWTANIAA